MCADTQLRNTRAMETLTREVTPASCGGIGLMGWAGLCTRVSGSPPQLLARLKPRSKMRLHVTLREEPLGGSELQVVVRCGVWNNERIRGTFPNAAREAYEELLQRHPDLRARLTAQYGAELAVVSVFARPREAGLLPDAVGADDLRRWLATHDPVNRYGKYREAVIASLRLAGYEVLPTDTVLLTDTGERHFEPVGDHYDIVVADLSDEVLDELLSHFSEEIINSSRPKPGKTRSQGLLPDGEKGTL